MNKKVIYFGAGFGAGIYIFLYAFLFLIPCLVDPSDCSGRDIGIFILSLPASNVIEWLPSTSSIWAEMFFVFVAGVLQYTVVFAALAYLVVKIKQRIKHT